MSDTVFDIFVVYLHRTRVLYGPGICIDVSMLLSCLFSSTSSWIVKRDIFISYMSGKYDKITRMQKQIILINLSITCELKTLLYPSCQSTWGTKNPKFHIFLSHVLKNQTLEEKTAIQLQLHNFQEIEVYDFPLEPQSIKNTIFP